MTKRQLTPIAASLALLLQPAWAAPPAAANLPTHPPAALAASGADAMPALMLARNWPAGRSPAGFLVSEKYDGVRAFWDGRSLRFRSGLPIAAPLWFTQALPPVPLDGELWLGRGQFERLSGMVRRSEPQDEDWRGVRYMVFDLPGAPQAFAERAARLADIVQDAAHPWLHAVAQESMPDAAALHARLRQVVQTGGEGLVLHRADALWTPGRSDALLKFKPVPDDDARVVGYLPGKGRNAGRLGALLLELPGGMRWALGSGLSDALRAAPPPIGSWVTYRYRSLTAAGVPRFATFVRVRELP